MYTNEDLKTMQGWSLQRKIQVTQTRIIEWYQKFDGKVYVSFSGGKDSTVLADVTTRLCKSMDWSLKLVFVDTGLEYPQIRKFVKEFAEWLKLQYQIEVELIILKPEKYNRKLKTYKRYAFKDVIDKYGYPIISKKVANSISRFRINPEEEWRYNKFILGINKDGTKMQFAIPKKWQDIAINAPFKISDNCCTIMKHQPCIRYEKLTGEKPIIAMMADDDRKREREYKETGCNAFNLKRPMSNPMGFWMEQDVLTYIKEFNISYCNVYGDIVQEKGLLKTTGENRTGCMFCCFGVDQQSEPNRFQRMKMTHPKQYEYCIRPIDENGLGLGEVLDYIGVKY